jgi:hypothetical protein
MSMQLAALHAGSAVALGAVIAPATYFGWILACGLACIVAIVRVLRRPAEHWPHRNWSKLAWIAAALYLSIPFAGYPIPVGAIAAIWATTKEPSQPATTLNLPIEPGNPQWLGNREAQGD